FEDVFGIGFGVDEQRWAFGNVAVEGEVAVLERFDNWHSDYSTVLEVTASTVTKQWEAACTGLVNREQFKLSSPEGVLHTAATAMHRKDIDVRSANDDTYAMNSSQVTKPESLILQRHRTIPAPLQLPKADKASVLVGIRTPSRGNRPAP
ncbi:MAG: hypothetical protein RR897_09890, partial [Pseudomonas sp.]